MSINLIDLTFTQRGGLPYLNEKLSSHIVPHFIKWSFQMEISRELYRLSEQYNGMISTITLEETTPSRVPPCIFSSI